jgi:CheY-like chemotaxis protein
VKRESINRRGGRAGRARGPAVRPREAPPRPREADPDSPVAPGAETADRSALPFFGRRVLLVDDNAGIAALLAGLLFDAGATVDVCRSPDAAVAQAARRRPDVVVVHLPLPKDAATSLTQRLRHHPALAGVRVIILSGEDSMHGEGAEEADAVHPRPISPQRLLDDVARLLLLTPKTEDQPEQ